MEDIYKKILFANSKNEENEIYMRDMRDRIPMRRKYQSNCQKFS